MPHTEDWIILNTKNIAREAAEAAAKKAIELHIAMCPYGREIGRSKAFMMGCGFVLTILGFGIGAAITKLVGLWK